MVETHEYPCQDCGQVVTPTTKHTLEHCEGYRAALARDVVTAETIKHVVFHWIYATFPSGGVSTILAGELVGVIYALRLPKMTRDRLVEIIIAAELHHVTGFNREEEIADAILEVRDLDARVVELEGAVRVARHRFSEQDGQVSGEVWNGNYEAVRVLDRVLPRADLEAK